MEKTAFLLLHVFFFLCMISHIRKEGFSANSKWYFIIGKPLRFLGTSNRFPAGISDFQHQIGSLLCRGIPALRWFWLSGASPYKIRSDSHLSSVRRRTRNHFIPFRTGRHLHFVRLLYLAFHQLWGIHHRRNRLRDSPDFFLRFC